MTELYKRTGYLLALCGLIMTVAATAAPPATIRDGSHDFDWDYGTWKTHQRRLLHPLTGSKTWVDYYGTDTVSKIWPGANTAKIEADGAAGHLEIFSVRMYDSDTHKWSVYFNTPGSGTWGTPVVGEFKDGGAEFFDHEPYKGKTIMVRFRVSGITKNAATFDQSFSPDDGKTWETNFIVTETLVTPGG